MKLFIKKLTKSKWTIKTLTMILCWYVSFVRYTTRWTVIGMDKLPQSSHFIFTSWHNRILMVDKMWQYQDKMNFIVSPSSDGNVLRMFLEYFKHNGLVGSSGSGTGTGVFKKALKLLKQGKNFSVAPDGSRGPRYHMKPGIGFLAQKASVPIVMTTYNIKNRIVLNSWDNFIVPLPFSKGVIMYDIVNYNEVADSDKFNEYLESQLTELTKNSDKYFNHNVIERA